MVFENFTTMYLQILNKKKVLYGAISNQSEIKTLILIYKKVFRQSYSL